MHIIGLAVGVGAATVKLLLLLRSISNHENFQVYFKIVKPITRLIVTGTILLTLSGIGWLLIGYSFSLLLIVKIVIVALIWMLGPVIDKILEPKAERLAMEGMASPGFVQITRQYVTLEILASSLMYAATFIGILL